MTASDVRHFTATNDYRNTTKIKKTNVIPDAGFSVWRVRATPPSIAANTVPAALTRDANGVYPNRRASSFRGRPGRPAVNLSKSVARTRRKIQYCAHDP